jgi:hypothetical protein
MKKKIFIVLFIILIGLGLTGCGKNSGLADGEKSDIEVTNNDVTLSIKEGSLTNTSATLILANNSSEDISYGEPYEIEVKKNNEWYKIDAELNFIMPAYGLAVREAREIELDWQYSYGSLSNGEYRIIKGIDVLKENGKYETFYVAAEFTIDD